MPQGSSWWCHLPAVPSAHSPLAGARGCAASRPHHRVTMWLWVLGSFWEVLVPVCPTEPHGQAVRGNLLLQTRGEEPLLCPQPL